MKILDLLFPRRCAVCDGILAAAKKGICPECQKKLIYVSEPKCKKCGKPIRNDREVFCSECGKRKHQYDRGLSLFVYNDAMKKSIYRFKYGNRREYKDFYGREICRCLGNEIKSLKADALIPIPLHKSKLHKRGFNQAELLARSVGDELGIPVVPNLVSRVKKTRPQKELNHAERENNLKRAFKIVPDDVKLSTVILFDDIYTTGSTMNAVSSILREKGVSRIYFVTLATGMSD